MLITCKCPILFSIVAIWHNSFDYNTLPSPQTGSSLRSFDRISFLVAHIQIEAIWYLLWKKIYAKSMQLNFMNAIKRQWKNFAFHSRFSNGLDTLSAFNSAIILDVNVVIVAGEGNCRIYSANWFVWKAKLLFVFDFQRKKHKLNAWCNTLSNTQHNYGYCDTFFIVHFMREHFHLWAFSKHQ